MNSSNNNLYVDIKSFNNTNDVRKFSAEAGFNNIIVNNREEVKVSVVRCEIPTNEIKMMCLKRDSVYKAYTHKSGAPNPTTIVDLCGDYWFIEDFLANVNRAFVGVCKFEVEDEYFKVVVEASATLGDRIYIDNRLSKIFRFFDNVFSYSMDRECTEMVLLRSGSTTVKQRFSTVSRCYQYKSISLISNLPTHDEIMISDKKDYVPSNQLTDIVISGENYQDMLTTVLYTPTAEYRRLTCYQKDITNIYITADVVYSNGEIRPLMQGIESYFNIKILFEKVIN